MKKNITLKTDLCHGNFNLVQNLFSLSIVTGLSRRLICRDHFQVQIEKGKLTIACSRSPQNLKFDHWTLFFPGNGREMYQNVQCTGAETLFTLIKPTVLCCSLSFYIVAAKRSIMKYRNASKAIRFVPVFVSLP